ncbi:MAG TPA: PepSY domain-containing protein [Candidatus Kapabacteria bacterium]|nr:PepSY domain-containing protein [Candidatus Kapabacteria bacterium]
MAGALAACVLTAGVLTGCSDNAASPLPPDTDPLGNNATIQTSDPVSPQEANDVRNNVRKNADDSIAVQPDEAAETARKEYPNAEVYSVNLDYDRDSVNYECIVKSGGKYYVVVIDPQTGEVIDKDEVDEDKVAYITVIIIRPQTVKVKDAKERAKKVVNGDCVEINLEEVDGRTTYVIVILTQDNRYVTVYIDAESGRERKLKDDGKCSEDDDDDDDGDKHKNKRGRGHYRHGNGKGYGHKYHCHCECTDDDGQEIPDSLNVIKIDSARSIVRTMVDSTTISNVKLVTQDTANVYYDVTFNRDSSVYLVRLDAKTGRFISATQTGGRFDSTSYEFRPPVVSDSSGTDTLVALSVARTAATAQVIGPVIGWKLEFDTTENKWVYTFTIRETATNTEKKVLVDAVTGVYIRTI